MNRRDQREQAFILIFERTINNDTIAQIVENAGEVQRFGAFCVCRKSSNRRTG